MLTAIVFLLILTVAVVIHELAHFFNAKSVGVPVRAFSVGMGPVLWRKTWRGTEWRISMLPLGGYVDLPGLAAEPDENGVLQHPKEGLATKNVWQKIWVLIGGVLANFILAILLIAIVISAEPQYRAATSGIPIASGAVIEQVVNSSPAEELGIQEKDRILDINGVSEPSIEQVQQQIRTSDKLSLVLERGEETVTVETSWPPDGITATPILGVALGPFEILTPPSISFGEALAESSNFIVTVIPRAVIDTVSGIGQTFAGRASQNEGIVGPVGIVNLVGQAVGSGLIAVLWMAGIINFSLGLFNLLPIPGLDGGRMLIAIIIALRGKPFKPGQEEFIHFLGFMSLIVFVILITINDVSRFFGG